MDMINKMPLLVYVDIHHCCNQEVVLVGTHLNFYYIHDSFIHLLPYHSKLHSLSYWKSVVK
jgi:hypothetical protein